MSAVKLLSLAGQDQAVPVDETRDTVTAALSKPAVPLHAQVVRVAACLHTMDAAAEALAVVACTCAAAGRLCGHRRGIIIIDGTGYGCGGPG